MNRKETRRELKKAGHKHFRKHYLVLIFLCLILSFFGTEGGESVGLFGFQFRNVPVQAVGSILNSDDVFINIITGNLAKSREAVSGHEKAIPEEIDNNRALGTTNGVLAGVVNSVVSGRFFLSIAERIYSVTQSETVTGIVFTILSLLMVFLFWMCFSNVLSAVVRRMFLEGRTYEKLPFSDILHFAAFRKWFHACWAMFVRSVFEILWALTIVGWFIKHYSYYLVDHIVAENPGIKATEAIRLSQRMMYGHRLEAFILDLSMLPWILLSMVTFGLSDLFYGFPYRIAVHTEFYVHLRASAKENELEGAYLLNDTYLYEKADRLDLYDRYFDIVDMQTLVIENKIELNKVQHFFLNWLGLWFGSLKNKKKYDTVEGWNYQIARGVRSRDGHAYPLRMNGYWKERKKHAVPFSFIRSYSLWAMMVLFITFCIVGWTWEVCLHLSQTGEFVNRGMLHGPWLPIYGVGGVVALLLCSRFRKNPVAEFFVAVVLCGAIEYFTGWFLEMKYHERWWSYDGYFLNLHGRICAEGLLVFGIACMLVVYLIAPVFDVILAKIPNKVLRVVAIGLMAVFLIDVVYSGAHPNIVPGAVEKKESSVITEETVADIFQGQDQRGAQF